MNMPRISLFALCALLGACAIVEIVIASVVIGNMYSLDIFLPLENRAAMIVLITSGIVTIICSAIGVAGLMKNNKYLFLCGIVDIANIILHVAGFSVAFHSNAISEAPELLTRVKLLYYLAPEAKELWDDMQSKLQCCGLIGPTEWRNIPESCCTEAPCSLQNAFEEGCYQKTEWYFYDLTQGVAGLAAAMTILQLILVGVALLKTPIIRGPNRATA